MSDVIPVAGSQYLGFPSETRGCSIDRTNVQGLDAQGKTRISALWTTSGQPPGPHSSPPWSDWFADHKGETRANCRGHFTSRIPGSDGSPILHPFASVSRCFHMGEHRSHLPSNWPKVAVDHVAHLPRRVGRTASRRLGVRTSLRDRGETKDQSDAQRLAAPQRTKTRRQQDCWAFWLMLSKER